MFVHVCVSGYQGYTKPGLGKPVDYRKSEIPRLVKVAQVKASLLPKI